MRLTARQLAIAYNLGAIASGLSLMMLLADAFHVAQRHESVTLTRFGFAFGWVVAAILRTPYQWDRIWLRVHMLFQILVFSVVCCLYLVAGVD